MNIFSYIYLISFLLFLCTGVIQAQEKTGACRITEIQFDIDGKTREGALKNYLNLTDEDFVFIDYASMLQFAGLVKQELLNLRVFESVDIVLIPREIKRESRNPYLLIVRIKDSWTLFPLIVPAFDTNDELSLKWKINYANVAGSLIELNIDGDFGISQNLGRNKPGINYWEVETGLSNFYYRGIALSGTWIQGYYRIIDKIGTKIESFYTFNRSEFILTGNYNLGDGYFYEAAPAVELSYNYQDKLEDGSGNMETEPQSYGIYQRGGRDKVNWKGNFLWGEYWEGLLKSRIVPGEGFKAALFLSNRWYTILSDKIAFSNRVTGFASWDDEQYGAGEYIRGVADFNMAGDSGLFVNSTLPMSLFTWKGVMETQVQPFLDLGVVHPAGRNIIPEVDMRMSSGFDLVFFPEMIASVNLRFTFGLDLFGPGSFSDRFEMLLSTSLFY